MGSNGKSRRHPLLGAVPSGCEGTYVRDGAPCQGCPDCDYVARAAAERGAAQRAAERPPKRPSARRKNPMEPDMGADITPERGSTLGMIWDEDLQAPVPLPPPAPPVSIAELAEREEPEEPSFGTLLKRVGAAALRRLARKLDPEE